MSKFAYSLEVKGFTPCKPWKGDFNLDTMQCLDENGQVYMAGARKCGKADCVNSSHIELEAPAKLQPSWKQLIAEQWDISYRTGKKLNYTQLLQKLRREQNEVSRMSKLHRLRAEQELPFA